MRIVFDFHGKDPCVGGGGSLYSNKITEAPTWPGFSVELTICDTDQPRDGKPFWEGDAIHWEGNGETILAALKQAISVVELAEEHARKQFAKRVERTEQCVCGCWVERMDNGKLMPHHDVFVEGSPLCNKQPNTGRLVIV
jgi:hypothetical protein